MVTTALQRMHRQKGRRQAQAHGLTWALREQLLVASGNRLIDTRNRALLAVAYDALLRRSELVSLQVLDLMMDNDGSAALFIRRGKTDQEGEGAMLFLAPDSVTLVREWDREGQNHRGTAVPLPAQGRAFEGAAEPRAGLPDLQVDGPKGRTRGGHRDRIVGPQRPRGGGPGHDRFRHRTAGDPAGGTVEIHHHGEPLRGASAGPPERFGATGGTPEPYFSSLRGGSGRSGSG